MKKIRRFTASFLIICLIFSLNAASFTWGAEEKENTYVLTLDANGGELEISDENIDELEEIGVKIIFEKKSVLDSNILKDADVASGSDAEEDSKEDDEPEIASDSNAKMRAFGKVENQSLQNTSKIQLSVPEGTELGEILGNVESVNHKYIQNWTSEKNNVLTTTYGPIGDHWHTACYSDMMLYPLWEEQIMRYENPDEEAWGYIIYANATADITVMVDEPIMTRSEFLEGAKVIGDKYAENEVDYQRAFQINTSGYPGSPVGFILDVIGKKEQACNIFRLSNDGKTIIEKEDCVHFMHGGKEGDIEAYGNNLAFMVTGNDKYLVVPNVDSNIQMHNVTIDKVKGGVSVASAFITDSDGKELQIPYPVGETFSVPYGTDLDLEDIPYGYSWLGIDNYMSDEEASKYAEEIPEVVLQKYIITSASGEQISIFPDTALEVRNDMRITPVFVEDKDDSGGNSSGNSSSKPVPGLAKRAYSEERKIDTELTIYEGHRYNPSYKITVQNLTLCANDRDNDKFYLENGKLKSKDILPYGNYRVSVEFDYKGTHYSGASKSTDERINYLSISVGSAVEFVSPVAYAKFNGKEYPISSSEFGGDYFHVSPNTTLGELKNQLDDDATTAPMNYEFSEWVGLDQKTISDTKKVGDGLIAVAKYVNADGKEYHPVIEPLSGGNGNEEENPGGNDNPGGNNGNNNSSGNSGGGGSSTSSSSRQYLMYGTWAADNGIWRFKKTNGEYAKNEWGLINGSYYYFGADSNMVTGWYKIGDTWYYLNTTAGSTQGAMQTNWVFDPVAKSWFYLDASGAMLTGWQLISGHWYYLNPISDGTQGTMATNRWIDGYYVDATGARATIPAQ